MTLPLDGITVLDLSQVGPASRCTGALRDLGARVTKVLPPADSGRIVPPFYAYGAGRDMNAVRIDVRAPDGREEFLGLVARADVVVESYRPGVADRLGIGFEACRAVNASIVYAAVSGYGTDGPYAQRAGHDLNYLAVGGFLGCQGTRADGGPALPGVTLADSAGGGMHAALSICAALVGRARDGDGRFLDVSTTDGVLHLMSLFVDEYLATGAETKPASALLTGKYAYYDLYAARDGGWLAVAAIEAKFFATLCALLGREDLIPLQYDDNAQDRVRAALRDAFARKDRDEWVRILGDADTCVSPVLSISEVVADPHLARRIVERVDVEYGSFRQVGPVLATGAVG